MLNLTARFIELMGMLKLAKVKMWNKSRGNVMILVLSNFLNSTKISLYSICYSIIITISTIVNTSYIKQFKSVIVLRLVPFLGGETPSLRSGCFLIFFHHVVDILRVVRWTFLKHSLHHLAVLLEHSLLILKGVDVHLFDVHNCGEYVIYHT